MSKKKGLAISNDYQNWSGGFPKGSGDVKPSGDYQNWKLGTIFKHIPEETEEAETKDETAKDQEKDNTTANKPNQAEQDRNQVNSLMSGLTELGVEDESNFTAASLAKDDSDKAQEPKAEDMVGVGKADSQKNITDPESKEQPGDVKAAAPLPGTQGHLEQNDEATVYTRETEMYSQSLNTEEKRKKHEEDMKTPASMETLNKLLKKKNNQ